MYVARTGQNTANKVYFLIGLSTDQKANSFGLASFCLAAKLHRQSGSDRLEINSQLTCGDITIICETVHYILIRPFRSAQIAASVRGGHPISA
jgi:hypothetical protein